MCSAAIAFSHTALRSRHLRTSLLAFLALIFTRERERDEPLVSSCLVFTLVDSALSAQLRIVTKGAEADERERGPAGILER